MSLNLPSVIGHRGAAAYAPENTLAGFRSAHALGCTWVEFDIRLTGDGALVVCHDDKLDRTTDRRGRISRLPLAAVRQADAGRWFAASFAGEVVPTLDEALTLCRELGLGANIEIKAERGRGPATAVALADTLGRLAGSRPILISSFLQDAVAEASHLLPAVPRGMLWRKIPRGWQKLADALGCATIHAGHTELSALVAAQIVGAGYLLLAYTVNDPARARQLAEWGVASVFSDAPDIVCPMTGAAARAPASARRGASL